MLKVGDLERIMRAIRREGKSIRQVAREFHHSRKTIRKALRKGVEALSISSAPTEDLPSCWPSTGPSLTLF